MLLQHQHLVERGRAGDRRRAPALPHGGALERVRAIDDPLWLDADTIVHRDDVRGGAARRRRGDRGGTARRLRARRAARPPRAAAAARWGSACSTTSRSRRAGAQAELGLERVAIVDWDVHHGNGTQDDLRGDDRVLFVSLHQWPFYPGTGGPGRPARDHASTSRWRPARATTSTSHAFEHTVEPAVAALRAGARARLGGLRRARGRPARRHAASPRTASASSPAAAPRWRPRVAAVLEGGYDLETLPALVDAALEGFTRG